MNYNAAIFDFDGTLANTAEDVWRSVTYAAEQLGRTLDRRFMENPSNLGAVPEELFQAVQPSLSPDLQEVFQNEIRRHYREKNTFPSTDLYPGIAPLLERMKQEGFPRFIVSAKPLAALERILFKKKWDGFFCGWYSQEPEQGIRITKSQLITSLLNGPLSGHCSLYIGDTWTDVTAARESGIHCVGALYGDGDAKLLIAAKPEHLVREASELERFFFGGQSPDASGERM